MYQIYECIIFQSIDDNYDDDGNNSDDYVDELHWWIELLRKVCLLFYKLRRCQICSPSLIPKSMRIWKNPNFFLHLRKS